MNWHYTLNGSRVGPVDQESVVQQFRSGVINEDSLVWTDEFGSEWRRYGDVTAFRGTGGPPPLPFRAISDLWIWMIAALPLALLLANRFLFNNQLQATEIGVAAAVLNCVLAYLDDRSIKQTGRRVASIWGLALIFIPAYIFLRSKRLGKNQLPLLVWIAAVAFSISAPSTMPEQFATLPSCSDGAAIDKVKELFPKIPANFTKLAATEVRDMSATLESRKRMECLATIVTTIGSDVPVKYTMDLRDDGLVWYQVSLP